MPVGFLSDDQASVFGRFDGSPSTAELARFFLLDAADRLLVERRRGAANRLGFALQLCTVRFLGVFVGVPHDVPAEVVAYVAVQLDVDVAVIDGYATREKTALEHQWEIRRLLGYVDFATVELALRQFLAARAWTRRERPSELFDHAVVWLRDAKVLLPGVSILTRLVSELRAGADQQMYSMIVAAVPAGLAERLGELLTVGDDARVSPLERLRRSPTMASGRQLVLALQRVVELRSIAADRVDVRKIPDARLDALARYGLASDVAALRRLPVARRLATMVAVVRSLLITAIDDALDVFTVLMAVKLIRPAERASDRQRLRVWDELAGASATLASTGRVLLELIADTDDPDDPLDPAIAWGRLVTTVRADRLARAVEIAGDVAPAATDRDRRAGARAELVTRYATVAQFLGVFADTIPFAAVDAGAEVLVALRQLASVVSVSRLGRRDVIESVVTGSWRPLVFTNDPETAGIDHRAYVLCVLEAVHQALRRRDIYVVGSRRWGDPRARLISGAAWERTRPVMLTALRLTQDPTRHLRELAARIDARYLDLAARLDTSDPSSIIETDSTGRGRLRVAQLDAIPEPDSLVELRSLVAAMIPRVDLPEALMEVHAWTGCFDEFSHYALADNPTGTRMDDLAISLAAVLVAEGCNLGFTPVIKPGVAALTRNRLSHVNQNYVRAETLAAANARLIDTQANIATARIWGGGLVASVDGLRFVVPVRTLDAGPNPRYFGHGRGITWLNAINDQVAGIGAVVVTGTMRDSLYVLDVILNRDGGPQPEIIATDTASYSDIVFGLFRMLGYQFSPRIADLADQRLWRLTPPGRHPTDYGTLNGLPIHNLNARRITSHWDDMLRITTSLHTGIVNSHDLIRMLARDGNPTPLGTAFADYGRAAKTLHILSMTEPGDTRRRVVSRQLNTQEGRHRLGRKVFFGRRGELRQAYRTGQEDQLGTLGLVLNAIVLWNTTYIDSALNELRRQRHQVNDADVARLTPLIDEHLNVHGRYTFTNPNPDDTLRPLRDPTTPDDE